MARKKPFYFCSLLALFILPTFIFGYFIIDKVSLLKVIVFGLICMFIGAMWDVWATKHGWRDKFWLWNFNEKYMLGPKFADIPIEEWAFFFFGAAFSVTLWELINDLLNNPTAKGFTLVFVVFIWVFAAITLPKLKEPN